MIFRGRVDKFGARLGMNMLLMAGVDDFAEGKYENGCDRAY